jgi:hypothetical protein
VAFDSKGIVAKFAQLKREGLVSIADKENDIKSPDTVTRLMKWGDILKHWNMYSTWQELQRYDGGLTVFAQWPFATTFVNLVRSDEGTAKYVLTVCKMCLETQENSLVAALNEAGKKASLPIWL